MTTSDGQDSPRDRDMDSYFETVNKIGESIVLWARPVGWEEGPTSVSDTDDLPTYEGVGTWPLVNFGQAFSIALGYLVFVLIGRTVMPFLPPVPGLYPIKFLYNIVQVMLCSYMCIEAGVRAYSAGYSLVPCEPFNHQDPPIGFILYVFYLSKILDFMDTVFIILEKRWAQLSFLHVYHHFSIFLFYWLNATVGYDGDVYLTIVLNGFIHTIMYTYYFITLHTKDVWWKSALTLSQIIQFITMNAQALYLLYTGCRNYPPNIIWAYFYYIISLLVLFGNFFIESYVLKKRKDTGKLKKSQ